MQKSRLGAIQAQISQRELEIERAPIGYLRLDPQCRIVAWNGAAERMFGFCRMETLGMGPPFEQLLPKEFWPDAEKLIDRIEHGDMSANSVNENLTKDGRRITCEWTNTPILTPNGNYAGMQCWARNVTDVRHAQSLALLGKLATSAAHDFSNLAEVMSTSSEVLQFSIQPSDPLHELADRVRTASVQATRLTRHLCDIALDTWSSPVILNVGSVLSELEMVLRRLLNKNVELSVCIDSDAWPVHASKDQLQRMILNLAFNARDSMPHGGQLTIESRNVAVGQDATEYPDCRPGDYLSLSLRDSGHGMDEATQARIFEPFFTTKGDKGMGIGLALVKGLVHRWGGQILVQSKLNYGTKVEILLPRASH
jgi:PAS domain S-box-containing protein